MKIKRFLNRKGFTLAEMLIVVAILVILTAVAAPNVAKYVKSIKLRELDDSARSIYMAAEHELKSDIEMGRDIAKDNELDVPDRYTEGGTTGVEKINYLVYYGTVPSGGIISTGAIEPELAANNYVIEFNAETGDVYGVFYSTEPTEFNDYKEKYNDDSGKYAKAVNKTADRVGTLGYYGLENVAVTVPPTPDKIPEPEVRVINAEKLVLEVTNPALNPDAYVEIIVNDIKIVSREIGAYIVAGSTAVFVLDTLEGNTDNITVKSLHDVVFEKPFSEWATGITPGEELEIKVTFYDPKGVAIDQTKTVKTNSLFADGSSPETANIEYGRHLQNLGKCDTVTTVSVDRTLDFNKTGGDKYECWADEYPGRHFNPISNISTVNISAKPGVEIRNIYIDGAGLFSYISGTAKNLKFVNPTVESNSDAGVICGSATELDSDNIVIVNATISAPTGSVGGIAAYYYEGSITDCAIYVEGNKNEWENPETDPYSKYTITGILFAGGFVGNAADLDITNSYTSVKVSGLYAGGLIGTVYSNVKITDSFAAGHTYYGIYDGKAKDNTEVNLKANISGTCAGGIVGNHQSTDDIELCGTVFSTCSVTGSTGSDVFIGYLVYKTIVIDPDATVYALGTAYITDNTGKETPTKDSQYKPTAAGEKGVLSAADFGTYTGSSGARRYDTLVSSVFKYPLPSGMVMHGDWPSGEPVTGFFYWEKEGENYKIHSLYYDPQNPTSDGSPKEGGSLGNADDVAVSESGYGIFCIDGDVDGAKYYPRDGAAFSATPIDNFSTVMDEVSPADSRNGEIVTALKDALKPDTKLKITDSNFNTAIYVTGDGSAKKGSIKATLNEKTFTFAPYFYGLEGGESGFGNSDKPFEVRTAQHLDNVRYFLSMNFKQVHDLLPGAIKPIGDSKAKFEGTYDGNGFDIIDMKITVSDPNEPAGMFGTTDGATLENIVLRASAENTNFVETSPATPTATALSALVGSPISGINEMLAAVDGEGFRADVVVGEKNSTYGYLLFEGQDAYDFLNAYVNNIGSENLVRITPVPNNSCQLYFVSNDITNGFGYCYAETLQQDKNGNLIFVLSDIVKEKVPLNAKDLKIYLNSSDYSTGQEITVYIGEDYDHMHWEGSYQHNETSHWRQCGVTGCDYKYPASEHIYQNDFYANVKNESGHQFQCTVCGYKTQLEEHVLVWTSQDDKGHIGTCSTCGYSTGTLSHRFNSDNVCEDCHFKTTHHFVWQSDAVQHWYECDHSEGCSDNIKFGWEHHAFKYVDKGEQHEVICTVCGYSYTEGHIQRHAEVDDTHHDLICDKCEKTYNQIEEHQFDSNGKCSVCGFLKPRPFGGITGLAKNTAISECKVLNYILDGDQLTTEASKDAADYEFGGFYDLTHEGSITGQSYYYIYPGQKCIICHGTKTGGCPYEYEMERFIKSAENAIKAGHPEYAYRFRVVLTKGGKLEHSANNAAKFYCENTEGHKGTGSPYSKDSPLHGSLINIDGDQYFEITAQAVHNAYYNWNALVESQDQTPPDFWEFGIYTELTSGNDYERLNATINEYEYASLLNITIGGIAGKIECGTGTSITKCETNITFGYAKTFGGIVGSASNCSAAAKINSNKALVNGSTKPLDKRVVKLGGILAVKDGEITLEENIAAFRNLDTSWQYVFAVAPDASETNKYVSNDKTAGYAKGLHTGVNEEKAQAISLEDFNKS